MNNRIILKHYQTGINNSRLKKRAMNKREKLTRRTLTLQGHIDCQVVIS